jgi:hypothetical protein
MNENMVLFLNVLISFFAVIGIVCFFGCIFNTVYELRNKRKSTAFLIADLDELSLKQAVKEAEYLFCSMYGDLFFGNERRYDIVCLICSDDEKAAAVKRKITEITGTEDEEAADICILKKESAEEAKKLIYTRIGI